MDMDGRRMIVSEEKLELRIVRDICIKCRTDTYKGHPSEEYAGWNDIADAWWPKEDAYDIYRRSFMKKHPDAIPYNTFSCPGPLVEAWNDELSSKMYECLLKSSDFTADEIDLIKMGYRKSKADYAWNRFKEFCPEDKKNELYKPLADDERSMLMKATMDNDGDRIEMRVHNEILTRYPFWDPPIWCPHKEDHIEGIKRIKLEVQTIT